MVSLLYPALSESDEGACGKPKTMTVKDRARSAGRRRPGRGAARHPSRLNDFLVVGLGASSGGLEALYKLFGALPSDTGMAFILVQHLDPTHGSMMVGLLAGHTAMTVSEAADGMPIERDHVYVIPPGVYLSISEGALRLTNPRERHGARMPFDFLLRSLAEECGGRAVFHQTSVVHHQYPSRGHHPGLRPGSPQGVRGSRQFFRSRWGCDRCLSRSAR